MLYLIIIRIKQLNWPCLSRLIEISATFTVPPDGWFSLESWPTTPYSFILQNCEFSLPFAKTGFPMSKNVISTYILEYKLT